MAIGPASVARAQAAGDPVTMPVSSAQTWTPTLISVKTGDSISVSAEGDIHFGPSPISRISPNGLRPSACADLIRREGKTRPFPAPGLRCWSLLGKIGTDAPFLVGEKTTFRATGDGALLLGVNDNRLADNKGTWTAEITVTPASSGGTTGSSSDGSSSSILPIVLGILGLAALFLFLFWRRRRGKDEPVVAGVDEPPNLILDDHLEPALLIAGAVTVDELVDEPVMQPAEQSAGLFGNRVRPLGTSVAPVEGEVVDVNIFEVELANGTDLRIGYNYFPEATELHWQVRQGSVFAHGQFPTNGGGNMYHYVTLPLGVSLEPTPAADVQFSWSIGGVPFRYSVRRDAGL